MVKADTYYPLSVCHFTKLLDDDEGLCVKKLRLQRDRSELVTMNVCVFVGPLTLWGSEDKSESTLS